MKAILLSIKPEWLVKILNGEKTIEVRKKFPKDYVGWVYIYCSKMKDKKHGTDQLLCDFKADKEDKYFVGGNWGNHSANDIEMPNHNGKVVARFWCDEVYIYNIENRYTFFDSAFNETCEKLMGICSPKLYEYVGDKIFYGIHISKLEIFDRPKYLCDFWNTKKGVFCCPLTKAPQNYCYVEGE